MTASKTGASNWMIRLERAMAPSGWKLILAPLLTFAIVLNALSLRAEELKPWTIGVAGPMSGDSAHLGKAMVDAVRLRVDEFNAAGGVGGRMIEVVEYDDENDAASAARVAANVANSSDALVVIGHRTSGASISAGPIYRASRIPVISGTATGPWASHLAQRYKLSTAG